MYWTTLLWRSCCSSPASAPHMSVHEQAKVRKQCAAQALACLVVLSYEAMTAVLQKKPWILRLKRHVSETLNRRTSVLHSLCCA